jgi:hypothetical protein
MIEQAEQETESLSAEEELRTDSIVKSSSISDEHGEALYPQPAKARELSSELPIDASTDRTDL